MDLSMLAHKRGTALLIHSPSYDFGRIKGALERESLSEAETLYKQSPLPHLPSTPLKAFLCMAAASQHPSVPLLKH